MFQNNKYFIGHSFDNIGRYIIILFILRLNAFSSPKPVRLMVLRTVVVKIVLECFVVLSNISLFFTVIKLGRGALVNLFLFPIISFITSHGFLIIFVWSDKIWIIVFFVYNSVPFQGSYSSKLFHTIFVSSRWFDWTFSHPRAMKTFSLDFYILLCKCLIVKAPQNSSKFIVLIIWGIFIQHMFPVNNKEKSFKIGYRFILYFPFCYVYWLITRI